MLDQTSNRVLFNEGYFLDDTGIVVSMYGVRLGEGCESESKEWAIGVPNVVRASRACDAIEVRKTVRVSKPERFRSEGETLISDSREGLVKREMVIEERVDNPVDMRRAHLINDELNRLAKLVESTRKTTTTGVRTKRSRSSTLYSGNKGWILCAALELTTNAEWKRWWASLDPSYDHVTRIYSPRMFARALGLMVVRKLGPRGSSVTMTDGITGEKIRRPSQAVFHGPVVYVEDTYDYAAAAPSDLERFFRPLFSKTTDYQDQREYRFVMWAEQEPSEYFVDLEVSLEMFEALQERRVSWLNQTNSSGVADAGLALRPVNPEATQRADEETVAGLKAATPVVSGSHQVARSADRPSAVSLDEQLKVYASIRVLRTLVNQTHNEPAAARAALHAESHIRRLCTQFEDPIESMYFYSDSLFINLKFPQGSEHEAKVAVGSGGTAYLRIGKRERIRYLPGSDELASQWTPATNIESRLRQLGLPRREVLATEDSVVIEEPTAVPTGIQASEVTQDDNAGPPRSSDDRPRFTSVFDMLDNPAVSQRPHQYDPDDPPKDLAAKTTVHVTVNELRNLAFKTGEQAAVSAAWHAETFIRRLCATFLDPIAEMRFLDNSLVVTVKFPQGSDGYGKIAVGPLGVAASKIGNGSGYVDSTCKGTQLEQQSLADEIERRLRDLGLPTPKKTAASNVPSRGLV